MNDANLAGNAMRLACGIALLAAAAAGKADSALHIFASPLYQGISPVNGIAPMRVEIQNTGPNAVGAVVVDSEGGSVTYPVELPQGSMKRLVVYPDLGDYSINPTRLTLDTDRGRVQTETKASFGGNSIGPGQFVFGMITENSGDLGFLRSVKGFATQPRDAYLRPEDAPGRPVAYARLNAVFLGTGSERISNEAVKALKAWALGGGVIVFTGGASSPVLNDPRWSDVMPVRNAAPRNFSGPNELSHRYGAATPTFTAMVGDPVPGAYHQMGSMILEKPIGLGRAVYVAVNPFEAPLQSWAGRGRLFLEVLSPAAFAASRLVASHVLQQEDRSSVSFAGPMGVAGSPVPRSMANNPFQAKLPATRTVFLILLTYFVAVVPLNFLVLRKMKRGEWAWATAPLLSVGFAAIFFASARELYGAGMSTSSEALVIAQEGTPGALVLGESQMFFPHGGSYDLHMSGVDALSKDSLDDPGYYYSGRNTKSQIDSLDTGEIKAVAEVPNLAFRQIFYRQLLPQSGWFEVDKVGPDKYRITNNSPFKLVNAHLGCFGSGVDVGTIAAKSSGLVLYLNPQVENEELASQFSRLLSRSQNLGLTGVLEGCRVGPIIGQDVASARGVRLAFVSDEKMPGATR